MAHGLSCSGACGIFPDQGSNPCPLHSQVDSLSHQGSPLCVHFVKNGCFLKTNTLQVKPLGDWTWKYERRFKGKNALLTWCAECLQWTDGSLRSNVERWLLRLNVQRRWDELPCWVYTWWPGAQERGSAPILSRP